MRSPVPVWTLRYTILEDEEAAAARRRGVRRPRFGWINIQVAEQYGWLGHLRHSPISAFALSLYLARERDWTARPRLEVIWDQDGGPWLLGYHPTWLTEDNTNYELDRLGTLYDVTRIAYEDVPNLAGYLFRAAFGDEGRKWYFLESAMHLQDRFLSSEAVGRTPIPNPQDHTPPPHAAPRGDDKGRVQLGGAPTGIRCSGSAVRTGIRCSGSAVRAGIRRPGSAVRAGIRRSGSAVQTGIRCPGPTVRAGIRCSGSAVRAGIRRSGTAVRVPQSEQASGAQVPQSEQASGAQVPQSEQASGAQAPQSKQASGALALQSRQASGAQVPQSIQVSGAQVTPLPGPLTLSEERHAAREQASGVAFLQRTIVHRSIAAGGVVDPPRMSQRRDSEFAQEVEQAEAERQLQKARVAGVCALGPQTPNEARGDQESSQSDQEWVKLCSSDDGGVFADWEDLDGHPLEEGTKLLRGASRRW